MLVSVSLRSAPIACALALAPFAASSLLAQRVLVSTDFSSRFEQTGVNSLGSAEYSLFYFVGGDNVSALPSAVDFTTNYAGIGTVSALMEPGFYDDSNPAYFATTSFISTSYAALFGLNLGASAPSGLITISSEVIGGDFNGDTTNVAVSGSTLPGPTRFGGELFSALASGQNASVQTIHFSSLSVPEGISSGSRVLRVTTADYETTPLDVMLAVDATSFDFDFGQLGAAAYLLTIQDQYVLDGVNYGSLTTLAFTVGAIPEPASFSLLCGVAGLALATSRRRRR